MKKSNKVNNLKIKAVIALIFIVIFSVFVKCFKIDVSVLDIVRLQELSDMLITIMITLSIPVFMLFNLKKFSMDNLSSTFDIENSNNIKSNFSKKRKENLILLFIFIVEYVSLYILIIILQSDFQLELPKYIDTILLHTIISCYLMYIYDFFYLIYELKKEYIGIISSEF